MIRFRWWLIAGFVLTAACTAAGQVPQDDRDTITLKRKKKPVRCTVLHRGETVSYSVKGKVRTVESARIEAMDTVNMRLEGFFEELDAAPRDDVEIQWALALAADAIGLADMAKLQAYRCLAIDSTFEPAHEHLGHRKRRGGYRWRLDGKLVPESEFRNPPRGRNDAPWLLSPHYRLRSSGDPIQAVNLLFDLERFRLFWMSRFRENLGVPEYQEVLGFEVGFIPARSTTDRPYFDPSQEHWFAYTVHDQASGPRPRDFFSLATQQHLNSLYAPLGSFKRMKVRPYAGGLYDREALWLEIGFGWWLGEQFGGDAGYAKRREPPRITPAEAGALLEWMRIGRSRGGSLGGGWKDLPNLIGWHFDKFYAESKDVEFRWLASRAFVAFLMSDGVVPGTEESVGTLDTSRGVVSYLRTVYRSARGNASSAFDDALGMKVERLERPFAAWLTAIAGT